MRALTVRHPWAWAIATGAKSIENRTRGTRYRGPLAIHAGREWSLRGENDRRVVRLGLDCLDHLEHPILGHGSKHGAEHLAMHWPGFHYAAVIAIAQLVDSHPDTGCCRPWGESSYSEAGGRTRTVIHHLVLEDIHQLTTPLPARGALGLWTPDPDLLHALGAAA